MSRPGGALEKQRPANRVSKYLHEDKNRILLDILGTNNSFSLATGMAQIEAADNGRRQWNKTGVGVVCFVKDYSSRAHFIRLFDLNRKATVFEQMLDADFHIRYPNIGLLDRLLTFEGDNCVLSLDFAFDDEARLFKSSLHRYYEQQHKQKKRRNNNTAVVEEAKGYHQEGGSTTTTTGGSSGAAAYDDGSASIGGNGGGRQTQISSNNNTAIPTTTAEAAAKRPAATAATSGDAVRRRNKKKGGKQGQRINKDDIGLPTNFEHRVHVGSDEETGGVQTQINDDDMDPNIKQLLNVLGVKATKLKQEAKKFIYEFVDNHGGVDQLGNLTLLIAFYQQSKSESTYAYQVLITVSKSLEVAAIGGYNIGLQRLAGLPPAEGALWFQKRYALMFTALRLGPVLHIHLIICSLLLTVAMAADRVFALARPLAYSKSNHARRLALAIVLCFGSPSVASVCHVWSLRIESSPDADADHNNGSYHYVPVVNDAYWGSNTQLVSTFLMLIIRCVALVSLVTLNVAMVALFRRRAREAAKMISFPEQMKAKKQLDKSLFVLSVWQSALMFVNQAPHLITYLTTMVSIEFALCYGALIEVPLADAAVFLTDTLDLPVVFAVNSKMRRMIKGVLTCGKHTNNNINQQQPQVAPA